ncbi:hypothetical protein I4641_21350 [Waterburya agarophytonicola K14]|uniref:Uncharacterized protein n=1 Tax=Waterburya agarophytonicola KI4 TaxID=2874699 RepID=A0A964C0K8_9CYAN|nr:hypothetical protein [Waterburya agarophytonicola]MCC0179510.1 hypothetical protein [Waterburya agarophytonicola KI4]
MSTKLVTVGNRLLTAAMLVALLIACQEMPENNNFGGIKIEHPAKGS